MRLTSFSDLPSSWWAAMIASVVISLALLYYTWRTGKK
jgi:membrane protein implicated in regulation of membrane protease activity